MKSTRHFITVPAIIVSAIIACAVIFCCLRGCDLTLLAPDRLPVTLLVIAAGITLGCSCGIWIIRQIIILLTKKSPWAKFMIFLVPGVYVVFHFGFQAYFNAVADLKHGRGHVFSHDLPGWLFASLMASYLGTLMLIVIQMFIIKARKAPQAAAESRL